VEAYPLAAKAEKILVSLSSHEHSNKESFLLEAYPLAATALEKILVSLRSHVLLAEPLLSKKYTGCP